MEYLDHAYPGATRLLPGDFDSQLQVRLWDRLFDQYVMDPMQRYIAQVLRPPEARDTQAMAAHEAALGLGLWIVGRVVAGHQGEVSIGDEPGGGTAEQLGETVKRDHARWGEVVKANNIRADS